MGTSPTAAPAALPVASWVDPAALRRDPYPTYARLRDGSPVAWVPSVGKVLITTFDGCMYAEQHPEIFSSNVSNAHIVRAMGSRPMIRKDDPEHAVERASVNAVLRPRPIARVWSEVFARNTRAALDRLREVPAGTADLNRDFARPLAAKNLLDLIGFRDVDTETFARWSADFIAGSGNVLEDEEIWERCDRSRTEAHAALDELLPFLAAHPDGSMASTMIAAGLPDEQVRANVFLTISGGVNEPQHMITSIALLLERAPAYRPAPDAPAEEWVPVFEEAVRYHTPIAMVTRQTREDVVVEGVLIPAESQIGLILASANRDPRQFSSPDEFIVGRPERRHLGFGSGAHICAGKWSAEWSVGRVAMPELYRAFPRLRVDPERELSWDGFAFRGLTALPVRWD